MGLSHNYRIEFGFRKEGKDIDYWGKNKKIPSFRDLLKIHYKNLRELLILAREYRSIIYIWWFFEPHVELTFLCENQGEAEEFIAKAIKYLEAQGIKDYKTYDPASGWFGDWYGKTREEQEFGARRHSFCANWIINYLVYKTHVDSGFGLENQVGRTIHTLCNPLGLNYMDEAKICYRRMIICLCYRFFKPKTAAWIFRNVFRIRWGA